MAHEKRPDIGRMLARVRRDYGETAKQTAPWFYENLPDYYFRTHGREEQARHLQALISCRLTGEDQTVVLQSPCGTVFTYITPGKWVKELLDILDRFSAEKIQTLRIITSKDQRLRISDVHTSPQNACSARSGSYRRAIRRVSQEAELADAERREFSGFLRAASQDYVDKFELRRALRHFAAYKRLRGGESVEATLEPGFEPGVERICLNMAAPPKSGVLQLAARILARQAMDLDRAYADIFDDGEREYLMISFYVNCREGCLTGDSSRWHQTRDELCLTKWKAPHGLDLLSDRNGWPMRRVMLLQAMCEFAHQFLIKVDLYKYASDRIVRAALNNPSVSAMLVQFFEARFEPHPDAGDRAAESAEAAVREAIAELPKEDERVVFFTMLKFVRHTLRTNYFLENRFGLSFRIDPDFLDEPIDGEMPFGIYFFHGPRCLGFHVRFRNTARGGVRLVPTQSQSRFELESNRLFNEVAALARTQQDKNKDIPEGGSKAVLLLGPEADRDLCVKSMVNSFLDLIVAGPDGKTLPGVRDHLGKREIIFLGPDENITPEHINWIVQRAQERGYDYPAAFMSSKPETGISHKEYGVTSLGVIVFMEEALRFIGVDPYTMPFSVKFTGGTRGDVASNAMLILMNRYGKNARILAATDGHGAAYDPEGLDHEELKRLIGAEIGIANFAPDRLSGEQAFVIAADKPENVRIRNELHNTAKADVFIPAGGRPDTINMENWENFLDKEGQPSSRILVEGANIFISPPARAKLEEAGVLAIQGSSANKTGVICSSYEILAGLTLSAEEFKAIRRRFVSEVLDILAVRAGDEARLLFREYKQAGGRRLLTPISHDISRAINSLADGVAVHLERQSRDYLQSGNARDLILSYCPPVLAQNYRDRIFEQVPAQHLRALVAHFIGARIVYSEGLRWVKAVTDVKDVQDVVMAYIDQEKRVASMCARLSSSRLADKEELARVLRAAGRKYLTMEKLGLE